MPNQCIQNLKLIQYTNPLARYQARLAARPLFTQAITTSVLFAVGDITAQQLVEKKGIEKHDITRTGRMALYGGGTSPLPTLLIVSISK